MQLPRNRNRKSYCDCDRCSEQTPQISLLHRDHHDTHRESYEYRRVGRPHDRREPRQQTKYQPVSYECCLRPAGRFIRSTKQRKHGANRDEQSRHVAHHQRRIRDEHRRQHHQQHRDRSGGSTDPHACHHEDKHDSKHRDDQRRKVKQGNLTAKQAGIKFQEEWVARSIARRVSISTEMQHRPTPLRQIQRRRSVFESVGPRHQLGGTSRTGWRCEPCEWGNYQHEEPRFQPAGNKRNARWRDDRRPR